MPLESNITGIQELNPAWPTGVDPISEGDNHARNTKDAVQKSFPGMTGAWQTSSAISCAGVDVNNGQVTNLAAPVNATDAARKGDLDAVDSRITQNESDIATNAANIATNASNILNNANAIASNDADISALDGRVTTNEGNITTNTSNITTNTNQLNVLPDRYSGGSVSGAGAIIGVPTGDFTVSKEGTGQYRLDFTTSAGSAFAQTLTVGVESASHQQRYALVDIRDANTVAVLIVNGSNGNAIDGQFNFMRFVHG